MGMSVALSNALSGMRVGQSALEVVSSNVANAGTPGYNKRSLSVIDSLGANSTSARESGVVRAFNQSLQQHYNTALAGSGFASVRNTYVDRIQTLIGMPGAAGSLDTAFNQFQSSLSTLAANTDSYASRADAVQKAQNLASTLNSLSSDIQGLRREVESQMSNAVDTINSELAALEKVNVRLADQGVDEGSRATLLDQRDRLVASLSEKMDLRVTYRADNSVSLMTTSGVGILDVKHSVLSFTPAGSLSASSQFSFDDTQSGVGKLMLTTPSGLEIDLVKQGVFKSGEMAAYIDLRDTTLVEAQSQLDEIASGLALSMSTVVSDGAPATSGAAAGYAADISGVRNGNEITISYLENGLTRTVRAVRVDDASKLPLDYVDANNARVIGIDFSGGAASVANQLQTKLGTGLSITSPSAGILQIVDDGVAGTTDVLGVKTKITASSLQGGELGVSLFVDSAGADYTNSLDGDGQKLGFASRITVNSAIAANNSMLVQYVPGGSLGDASRIDNILDNLDNLKFAGTTSGKGTGFPLSGSVSDLISQTVNFQGNAAATAAADSQTQDLTLESLNQRLDSEYAVNIDEEMGRLLELQNAYAANARILTIVQDLFDALLRA